MEILQPLTRWIGIAVLVVLVRRRPNDLGTDIVSAAHGGQIQTIELILKNKCITLTKSDEDKYSKSASLTCSNLNSFVMGDPIIPGPLESTILLLYFSHDSRLPLYAPEPSFRRGTRRHRRLGCRRAVRYRLRTRERDPSLCGCIPRPGCRDKSRIGTALPPYN